MSEKILQNISDQADEISKSVLAVYKPDQHHDVNKEALTKQTVEYLEKCANFLKIKLLNEANKKLYANKAALADRIILVLESFFPNYLPRLQW